MKKLFKILFLFFAIQTIAQQEVNTSFATQMNTMFAPIDKTRVPHGILLDFAMEFTNVPAYNGTVSDSTYVNPKVLKEIYNTLLMGRIISSTSAMTSAQDFENNWFTARSETQVTLAGLYYKYSRFVSNATTAGKLTFSNNQFRDRFANGVWQNPYEELRTFAITTPIEVFSGLQLNVVLPQALFYSNYGAEMQKIEIDFADGLGFRLVGYNQAVAVNYTTEGNKIWTYKLTLSGGQTMLSRSKIKILKGLRITNANSSNTAYRGLGGSAPWNNCNPANTDVYRLDIESVAAFNGQKGKARIFIDDAGNDCKITKPLIVVEGFDFTTLLDPESRFSSADYEKFTKTVFDSNSNTSSLISGNSWTSFGDQTYDIIYVNWDNGLDFIERNALVVEEVIKWVNSIKTGTEKLVVLGQSMGGVVCRYAIRDMEQRNITHNVRLFVSQDSPQEGANVPLSIQYLLRNVRNQLIKALLYGEAPLFMNVQPIENLFSLLDQPATRQMLKNRISTNYTLENSLHNSFYSNLRAKGFPQQGGIRNVAISNGSECGTTQNFNAGDILIAANAQAKLTFLSDILSTSTLPAFGVIAAVLIDPDFLNVSALSLLPGNSKFNSFLEDRALYPTGGNKIHDFSLSYTKKILWLFPVTTYIINKQLFQPSGLNLHYDNYGGGFIDIAGYSGRTSGGGSTSNWFVSTGYSYFLRDKFLLVPTPSSLAVNATTDIQYKTAYVGATPPSGQLTSPFINFTSAYKNPTDRNNNNEKHLEFNARNGNWLAAELKLQPDNTNCSFLCNSQPIIGVETLCNSGIYSAPAGASAYQWQIISGSDFVVLTNANSQNSTLTPVPNISGSVTIRVFLSGISTTNGKLQSCGFLDKTIWIGIPQFKELFFNGGQSSALCIAPIDFLTTSLPSHQVKAIFNGMSTAEILLNTNWQ